MARKEGNQFSDKEKTKRKNKKTSIGNSRNSRPIHKQFKRNKNRTKHKS
jgi:hypothetical protein